MNKWYIISQLTEKGLQELMRGSDKGIMENVVNSIKSSMGNKLVFTEE